MKGFIEESKKIINRASNNNKLVVFVGAGASMGAGLPSWKKLVQEFAMGMGRDVEKISSEEFLKIPQYYYNSRKEKEYYDVAQRMFDINVQPQKIHELIFKLNPNYVITTNYDTLLEQAALKEGLFYDVVAKDKDLPYTLNNKMIIKMHGDLKNKNIVLKEDDYLSYFKNFSLTETFIKSLIATNTLLFIGYSVSDVNVKYILQWVKDILKEDFQQAYFLECGDKQFEQVEFEYYKNRGINILYYSQLNIEENLKKDIGQQTEAFLTYFLEDEEGIISIESVYQQVCKLDILQYIRIEEIRKNIFGARWKKSGGNIQFVPWTRKGDKLVVVDEELRNVFKGINLDKTSNYKEKTICRIFYKAGIKIILDEDRQTIIDLRDFNIENQLEEMKNNFEYEAIKKVSDDVTSYQVEGNEKQYLDIAYSYYLMGKYKEAAKLLKQISQGYFLNKDYGMYAISEFNRYHILKTLAYGNPFVLSRYGIDINEQMVMQKEINKIDLDEIYMKLPKGERETLRFLKNILNFRFIYSENINIGEMIRKVEKEENTIFLGCEDEGTIYEFQVQIEDFYKFITKNRLMIDHYVEVKAVIKNYIECIFNSYAKPQKNVENEWKEIGKYCKKNFIQYLDCLLMVKYLTTEDIKNIFNNYSEINIKLEEEDLEKLRSSYINIVNTMMLNNHVLFIEEELRKMLIILSKVNMTKEFFECIIDSIIIRDKGKNIRDEDNLYKAVTTFIVGQANNNKKNVSVEKLEELLSFLINKVYICNAERKHATIISLLNQIIGHMYTEHRISRIGDIQTILLRNKKQINYSEMKLVMIPIYSNVGKKMQKQISSLLEKHFSKRVEYNIEDFELMYLACIYEIITIDKAIEDKILLCVDNIKSSKQIEGKYRVILGGEDEQSKVCRMIKNLFKSMKWINYEALLKCAQYDKEASFFHNMNIFDYNEFEVNWIKEYSNEFNKTICENEMAKQKIGELAREYIIEDAEDKELIRSLLQYYI